MDKSDRARYKQLANDSIIATFGSGGRELQLAEALEKVLSELERTDVVPHCETCQCYETRI